MEELENKKKRKKNAMPHIAFKFYPVPDIFHSGKKIAVPLHLTQLSGFCY